MEYENLLRDKYDNNILQNNSIDITTNTKIINNNPSSNNSSTH